MTAGSGILHQEMPKGDPGGRMHGFQLWANLPASLKMTRPRYQDVAAKDVPEVVDDDGTRVRIVVGSFWGRTGPVEGVAADPRYLDVSVPPGARRSLSVDRAYHVFAYVFEGSGSFRDASQPQAVATERVTQTGDEVLDRVGNRSLVLFDQGDEVTVQAGDDGVRFLLVSGRAARRAGGVAGPDRYEYASGTSAGLLRAAGRDVHKDALAVRGGSTHPSVDGPVFVPPDHGSVERRIRWI